MYRSPLLYLLFILLGTLTSHLSAQQSNGQDQKLMSKTHPDTILRLKTQQVKKLANGQGLPKYFQDIQRDG